MNLFVIIATYNATPWIKKCIDSVRQSTIANRIVVVDNDSTDQTLALIKELYNDIHIIEQVKNLGFGRANNIGITYALENGADYVYLLNQDAWVQPTTFETLIHVQNKNPEFGIISPMQTTADSEKLDKNFLFSCNKSCEGLTEDLYFNRTKEIYKIGFAPAAHWLISRECLLSVGGFSPTYFHYGEDGDYIDRVQFHNFEIGICPLITAVHDRGYRSEDRKKQMLMIFVELVNNCSSIYNRKVTKILNSLYFLFKTSCRYKSFAAIYYTVKLLLMYPKIVRYRNMVRRRYPNFLFTNR